MTKGASTQPKSDWIVTGVIGPFGIAGICELGSTWSITFQLLVWREDGGTVVRTPLRIEKPVLSEHLIPLWRLRIRKGQIVQLKVRDMDKPPEIMRTVEMVRLLGRPTDRELAEEARAILNPPDFEHPSLGRFTVSKTFHDVFERQGQWTGKPVKMTLEAGGASVAEAGDHLAELLTRQETIDAEFRRKIIEDLYQVWAEGWVDTSEVISPDDWIAKMTPGDVGVDGSGGLSIYYHDGDLFAGHSVIASLSPEGEIEEAMLVG